jgi:hypothetical protein
VSLSDTIIVWTIACGDATVEVSEDGRVWSDDDALRGRLEDMLRQPVDVSDTGAGGKQMVLEPSDRRYVVARVRQLCAAHDDLDVVGVHWTGEPGA